MKNLKNIEEMESVINKNEMALIYIYGGIVAMYAML